MLALAVLVASAAQPWRLLAQGVPAAKGVKFSQVSEADMKEWLSYLASDELQGRQIYTEGYGASAQYIADHLKAWGVKPMGDNGSYFQAVRMKGYRVTNNSSVTVTGPAGDDQGQVQFADQATAEIGELVGCHQQRRARVPDDLRHLRR